MKYVTPEQSKASRARLGLSQVTTAERAGVNRSYLNLFELRRWVPSDEFRQKLTSFYELHGALDSTIGKVARVVLSGAAVFLVLLSLGRR